MRSAAASKCNHHLRMRWITRVTFSFLQWDPYFFRDISVLFARPTHCSTVLCRAYIGVAFYTAVLCVTSAVHDSAGKHPPFCVRQL